MLQQRIAGLALIIGLTTSNAHAQNDPVCKLINRKPITNDSGAKIGTETRLMCTFENNKGEECTSVHIKKEINGKDPVISIADTHCEPTRKQRRREL